MGPSSNYFSESFYTQDIKWEKKLRRTWLIGTRARCGAGEGKQIVTGTKRAERYYMYTVLQCGKINTMIANKKCVL